METSVKKCPYCGEEIKIEAIKCRYCRETLDKNPLITLEKKNKIENPQFNQNLQAKNSNIVLLVALFGIICLIGFIIYSRAETNKQFIIQEENKQTIIKSQNDTRIAEENKQKETLQNLNTCLLLAETAYSTNWKSNCKTNADRVAEGYNNCLNLTSASYCRSLWGDPDSSESCSLPQNIATTIEEWRKDAKNDCYYKYPIK